MADVHMEKIYKQDPNIVSRKIAGEVILVPIHNNVADMDYIFTLNETAARVWELTDGGHSLAEIQQYLVAEFDVDTAQAAQDLIDLTQDLLEINAIVEVQA
jgi:hypothetical protein